MFDSTINPYISDKLECIFTHHIPQSKSRFNLKHQYLNQDYFKQIAVSILNTRYPRKCPACESRDYKTITTRETEVVCRDCKTHYSITSYTPLHHFKLPLWVFGYLVKEAMDLHPQPLTGAHIKRKLGVGSATATMLKRRLQLFLSDLMPGIKELMAEEIRKDFPEGFVLPEPGTDIKELVKDKAVVYSDTLALFSASQRANGYRSRYKHNGQTSSIYLTDSVAKDKGKYQIGTLVHTVAMKAGPVVFTSVPDQKQRSIEPLLEFLPRDHVHFSDEGFPWLHRIEENYRTINHSARAKCLNRNVWARERWSRGGVHNQVAEGMQRVLKTSMRNYCYVNPRYGQLYLDEFSALRALRVYGVERVLGRIGDCGGGMSLRASF